MIGYSEYGEGYLNPDLHDPWVQQLLDEEREIEAYYEDRREDTEYFLSVAFEDKSLKEEDLNEIFRIKWC